MSSIAGLNTGVPNLKEREDEEMTEGQNVSNPKFIIFPRKIWELSGHVWEGREKLRGQKEEDEL